mgnify:CR=1 FL=1
MGIDSDKHNHMSPYGFVNGAEIPCDIDTSIPRKLSFQGVVMEYTKENQDICPFLLWKRK